MPARMAMRITVGPDGCFGPAFRHGPWMMRMTVIHALILCMTGLLRSSSRLRHRLLPSSAMTWRLVIACKAEIRLSERSLVEWIRAETTGNRSRDAKSLTRPGREPTSQASHRKKTLARIVTPPSLPAYTATLPYCAAGRQLPAAAERSVPQRESASEPTSCAIRLARCHNFRSDRSRHAKIGNSTHLASPIACRGASAVRSRRNAEVAMSNENPDSLENRGVIQS